jgi:hypothetical protein
MDLSEPVKKHRGLKGTGFIPYVTPAISTLALASEGCFPRNSQ